MKIEQGQVWISESEPHRSIKIESVGEMWDSTDEGMYCTWSVYDEPSWSKFVLDKKFNGQGELENHIKDGKNTYPYAFGDDCSIKSI